VRGVWAVERVTGEAEWGRALMMLARF